MVAVALLQSKHTNTQLNTQPPMPGGGVLGTLAALSSQPNSFSDRESGHASDLETSLYHRPINSVYVPKAYRHRSHTLGEGGDEQRMSQSVMSERDDSLAQLEEEEYRRHRTRDFKVARNIFNRNPEQGIAYLINHGFVQPTPKSIALLFERHLGFNRQRIGEFLSTPASQSQLAASVLSHLSQSVDMAQVDLDVALRRFLTLFHLPGEAQRIERILRVFAHHFCLQNDAAFAFLSNEATFNDKCDTALLLSYAIVMLNTDLHSPAIRESRMSQSDFICNFQGADKHAAAMPAETLAAIYERIRNFPLIPSEDNTTNVSRIEEAVIGRTKPLVTSQRRLISFCCHVELKGDPRQNKVNEKPPVSNATVSSNRRTSFPASFAENLRSRQTDVKRGTDRQLFLFNDLLVVTKLGRRRLTNKRQSLSISSSNQDTPGKKGEVFVFRRALPLSGLSFTTFSEPNAPFGVRIVSRDENSKMPSIFHFCAKNQEDHDHFVQDLRDAIEEATYTEVTRVEMEAAGRVDIDKLVDPSLLLLKDDTVPAKVKPSKETSTTKDDAVRLLRRHSRTSLDSGVGEIAGSQMSIAVSATGTVTSSRRACCGSASAEKRVQEVSILSPEPDVIVASAVCVQTTNNNTNKNTKPVISSMSNRADQKRSRARSVDAMHC